MKRTVFCAALLLALGGIQASALAQSGRIDTSERLASLTRPGDTCAPAGASVCAAMREPASSHRKGVTFAAVTCGSDEWCCKHDIGGTGACLKCCPKPKKQ